LSVSYPSGNLPLTVSLPSITLPLPFPCSSLYPSLALPLPFPYPSLPFEKSLPLKNPTKTISNTPTKAATRRSSRLSNGKYFPFTTFPQLIAHTRLTLSFLSHSAYDVLSETESRNRYDQTGVVEKSVEDELLDSFGGGAFRDRGAEDVASKKTLEEALTVTQQQHNESHSAGFEAWQRSRGTGMNKTIGVEDIIETYGVVKGSYDEITLPKIRAFRVDRMSDDAAGGNKSSDGKSSSGAKFSLSSEPIPSTLEWGQVLLHIRASPVNPADLAPGTGAEAGSSLVDGIARKGSFTLGDVNIANAPKPTNLPAAGADFVAVVLKTGAGVKTLAEGDWVMPRHPSLGAWRSLFWYVCQAFPNPPHTVLSLSW
jgi:hypothetical protein